MHVSSSSCDMHVSASSYNMHVPSSSTIAETIARLGHDVRLKSVVADDEAGRSILAHLATLPFLDSSGVRVINGMTSAQYLSLNDSDGDLVAAVADMAIFSYLTPDSLTEDDIADAAMLVVDGNLPTLTLRNICQMANRIKVPVFFEPTSVPKAIAAAEEGVMNYVTFTSPNEKELRAMAAAVLRRKGAADADSKAANTHSQTHTTSKEPLSTIPHAASTGPATHVPSPDDSGQRARGAGHSLRCC